MDVDDFVRFQNFKHCKLVWRFDHVYHCRKLLETYIKGPDYGAKCTSTIPWELKLGQSTNPDQKGISLFIQGINQPSEILVNFRVCVRKSDTLEPLLDEKYQKVFGGESIWESPLIILNNNFKMVPQGKLLSDFWDISVEFIWNERIEPETRLKKVSCNFVSDLLNFREVGTDLNEFLKNCKFSDIYIRCENEIEIPCHKAILASRCPYFAQMINSYSGENASYPEEEASSLSPTKDANVMNTFVKYLYTGNIDSLTENGPLPIGIHRCAQRMKSYELEWLTAPLHLCGYSRVMAESVEYEWKIDNLCERIQEGDGACSIRSKAFGKNGAFFTLEIQLFMPPCGPVTVDVFLKLEELGTGDRIYAFFYLSAKNGGKEVISERTEGVLTPQNTIGFMKLSFTESFFKEPDTSFICGIDYIGEDWTTGIDKLTANCAVKPIIRSSPVFKLGDACHGWFMLCYDLARLLISANHSDCFIVVGGDRLPAHRIILAARSPYFSTVFDVKEKECAGTSKGMEILVQKDIDIIDPEMMKNILLEIYTASFKINDPQSAKNVYKFAKFFGLRSLEIKCLKFF